jgi:subtilase family serine protease
MQKSKWPLLAIVSLGVIGFFSLAAVSAEQKKPASSPTAGQIHQSGLAGTPQASMPDLELTAIGVNDKCHLWFTVTNKGATVINRDENCRLHYYVDDQSKIVALCTDITLNPGQSTTRRWPADSYPGNGTHKLKVVVDVTNVLVEKNEANNSKEITVTCGLHQVPPMPLEKK